jgi:hypothetical protein
MDPDPEAQKAPKKGKGRKQRSRRIAILSINWA